MNVTKEHGLTILKLAFDLEEHTGLYVKGTYQLCLDVLSQWYELKEDWMLRYLDTFERKEKKCQTR